LARDSRDSDSDERGDFGDIVAARGVDGAAALDGSAVAAVDGTSGSAEGAERDNDEGGELGEHFFSTVRKKSRVCRCRWI
jgi:hypothetical protein